MASSIGLDLMVSSSSCQPLSSPAVPQAACPAIPGWAPRVRRSGTSSFQKCCGLRWSV